MKWMARFYPLPGVWRNVKLGTGNLSHRGRKLANIHYPCCNAS
jgi:hypothetical protein